MSFKNYVKENIEEGIFSGKRSPEDDLVNIILRIVKEKSIEMKANPRNVIEKVLNRLSKEI